MVIKYLTETTVRQKAEALLEEHGHQHVLPVPVELLVERDLGIEIIPIPGFQDRFGIEGVLSQDLTRISVDEGVMLNVAPRYRFTLAHELGHLILHESEIREHLEGATDDHLMLWETLTETEYKRAEWQANEFARALLMPSEMVQRVFNEICDALHEQKLTFESLDDNSKMKVIRAKTSTFAVSADALRVTLIKEALIEDFENPERGGRH